MKKFGSIIAAGALALALAPFAAHADHCNDVFLFSGVDADGNRQGMNLGAEGCLVEPSAVGQAAGGDVDTNWLTPLAPQAWIGASTDAAPTAAEVSATVTIDDGTPFEVDFILNDLRGRYESETFDIDGATTVTFTVTGAGDFEQSQTYTALV